MAFYCTPLKYTADIAIRYFLQIRQLPRAVWLDSTNKGRFDILSAAPQTQLITNNTTTDPHHWLKEQLTHQSISNPDIPFSGGAIGFWSYELAHLWHPLKTTHQLPKQLSAFAIYDWAIIVDHQKKCTNLVSNQNYDSTPELLKQIQQLLQQEPNPSQHFRVNSEIHANFDKTSYQHAFNKIQHYLHEGDCYQVNLAQRFNADAEGDAISAYLQLRAQSPTPYAAFLDFPELQILSASPEQFISIQKGKVSTRPIKGTRPRHKDPQLDRALALELAQHPKDRAENLMIVDLLRNDLNKHCIAGSVKAPQLFTIESYANVHHLVSTITGELHPNSHPLDLFRDSFPGGSITGAPKLRAMHIIQELEPDAREVYCGSIGYLGFDGNMDSNIAIRTLIYDQKSIRCWAGGGIVADSKCDDEYQETLDKASAMIRLLQDFHTK